jgi:sec-independent protein translocase protein TatA
MGLGPTHIILLLVVIVLLFGAGKVSNLMGDVAKGIKSFKKGMAEDDEPARRIADERPLDARPIAPPPAEPGHPVGTPAPPSAAPVQPAATHDPDRPA